MEPKNYEVNALYVLPKLDSASEKLCSQQKTPTALEIQSWLVDHLAKLLKINLHEVDVKIPFDDYGLDSVVAVGLTGDLEDWLRREISPSLLYDYSTIEALAHHLAEDKFNVKA